MTGMVPLGRDRRDRAARAGLHDVGPRTSRAGLISVGAIVGLTSVLLVLLLGQSRIFFAMSRDGLLPPVFSRVHPRFRTPHLSTILVVGSWPVALIAGSSPLNELVELVSIGTLFAFVMVSVGVIVLRRTQPELRRPFRCPWVPVVPLVCDRRLPAT